MTLKRIVFYELSYYYLQSRITEYYCSERAARKAAVEDTTGTNFQVKQVVLEETYHGRFSRSETRLGRQAGGWEIKHKEEYRIPYPKIYKEICDYLESAEYQDLMDE